MRFPGSFLFSRLADASLGFRSNAVDMKVWIFPMIFALVIGGG